MSEEDTTSGDKAPAIGQLFDTEDHERVRRVIERQSQPDYRPPVPGETTRLRRAAEAMTEHVTTTRLRQLAAIASSALVGVGGVLMFHMSAIDDVREEERAAAAEQRREEREIFEAQLEDERADTERCEERLDRCRED